MVDFNGSFLVRRAGIAVEDMRSMNAVFVSGMFPILDLFRVGKLTAGTVRNCYVYESYSPTHNLYGTKGSYATIENSHVVMGTATVSGITNWTTEDLTDMESALNSHKPDGGKSWEGAVDYVETPATAAVPPHLEAYTVTAKKRHR